jgi:hypothetical protein
MARKHPLKCERGEKRFTVLRVDGDDRDTHAGRNFERALKLASPDRGSKVDVFVTCARDGAEARLASNFKSKGKLIKSFRAKRG